MDLRKIFIFILFFVSTSRVLNAEEWLVSDDKKAKTAPFKFSDSTRMKGTIIFQQNCASCHGNPGKANFVNLVPPPGDPATEKFSKQNDGSLFFKITAGRGAMPSFKDVLTEEQRWLVLSYVRSFHKDYVQPEVQSISAGTFGGMQVDILVSYDSLKKVFKAKALGKKDGSVKPIAGLEVMLYAKRYFGKLLIDEPRTTDEKGEAFFAYKDSLPGDTAGKIVFIIKINAEGLADYNKEQTFSNGKVLKAGSLIATRAMWTTAINAPIWLILAYSLVVIAVWAFLAYIVFNIIKIRKLGKKE